MSARAVWSKIQQDIGHLGAGLDALGVHAALYTVHTLSILKRAWYWGITALRGSVRICTSISSSRLCSGTTTGRRPTNSGIMPNSMRSRASTLPRSRSFSSISAIASTSFPELLARSAAAAARRPFPRLEGVPKPRYCRKCQKSVTHQNQLKFEDRKQLYFTVEKSPFHFSYGRWSGPARWKHLMPQTKCWLYPLAPSLLSTSYYSSLGHLWLFPQAVSANPEQKNENFNIQNLTIMTNYTMQKKLNSARAFYSAENDHIVMSILLLVAGLCPASQVDS